MEDIALDFGAITIDNSKKAVGRFYCFYINLRGINNFGSGRTVPLLHLFLQ